MLTILVYLIFILSVALSAGGIILTSRLRNTYKSEIFSTLLYYQVFIYTFGFYGIWGQVVIKAFLSSYISADLLARFSNIALLLGLPFLVFAWLMLIQFTSGLSGKRNNKWFIFWFLFINFSILVSLGYVIAKTTKINPGSLIRNYFIVMNLIYTFLASYLVHFPWKGRSVIHDYDRRIVAPAIFLIMLVQCVPLLFYTTQFWIAFIFIFTFFIGNTFLPVYFNYGTLLTAFSGERATDISFEEFCNKFEVSPRETDIIREICNGLSNKEISDKLFISLQTVKDHTHRIYIKTNVKSRVQLINLVKELKIL
ncbi:MAG: LuxR C-terminal-related transcriptional regulator [Bacteroidales bacterium]|nr:LuxR C-terminal-related transcriptional regulator [Bacteroidales bacterium]